MNTRTQRTVGGMRAGRTGLIAALSAAVLLSACSALPVSRTYIDEPKYGLYLALPATWVPLATGGGEADFLRAFAAPGADPASPLSGEAPGGYTGVRVIPGDLAQAETAAANAALADLAQAVAQGAAKILTGPLRTEDRHTVTLEWTVQANLVAGRPSVIAQRAVIGKVALPQPDGGSAHLVKILVVGCQQTCYESHAKEIEEVLTTWKVT